MIMQSGQNFGGEHYESSFSSLEVEETQKIKIGKWSEREHKIFQTYYFQLEKDQNKWDKIASILGTRTPCQVRSHAQKYFEKKQRDNNRIGKRQADMQLVKALKSEIIHGRTNFPPFLSHLLKLFNINLMVNNIDECTFRKTRSKVTKVRKNPRRRQQDSKIQPKRIQTIIIVCPPYKNQQSSLITSQNSPEFDPNTTSNNQDKFSFNTNFNKLKVQSLGVKDFNCKN